MVVKAENRDLLIGLAGFQSPCGEMVVKVYQVQMESAGRSAQMFQSPCGEMVVKGLVIILFGFGSCSGFSPLAGKWS